MKIFHKKKKMIYSKIKYKYNRAIIVYRDKILHYYKF